MPGLYLLIVLGGILGTAAIDFRYRVAFASAPKTAALTILFSIGFFSAWDLAGISAGVFFEGQTNWLVGWNLAPEYPIEEFFFLGLFSYTTLVVYRLISRRGSK